MEKRSCRPLVALLLTACALFLASCRKEPTKPEWDLDVVVPLIHTTLTLGDLVGDSLISSDGDGNVSLVYSARLFDLDLDTLLVAPDTSFRYKYPPFDLGSGSLQIFPSTVFDAVDEVTRFDLDEFELRELRVRSGQLDLTLANRLGTTIFGDFQLPGATLNGTPLTSSPVVLPGSAGSPAVVTQNIALDGYVFDLRGPGFNDVNTLATLLSLETDPAGPTVTMTNADSVEALVSYHDIVPQYARGYFGTRVIDIDPDSSDLNVFDGITGLLDIDEATARLKVLNGIGVDARAEISYIRSVNSTTGTTVDLVHAITSSPLNLDRALDLGNTFQPSTNTFTLTTNNSNIDAFIENLPSAIAYDLNVTTDPLGDVSNGNDFFYHESTLSADLELEIPMRLIATGLALSRKTTVDLEGSLEHHAFQYGTIHLFATNRFPFSAQLTLEIVSTDDVLLGTLAPGGTIASASLGMDGLVSSANTTELDFTISKEQVDLFYPGSAAGPTGARLRIGVVFNTADQTQHVQLRSDYTIDITASLEGNYIVNGDE